MSSSIWHNWSFPPPWNPVFILLFSLTLLRVQFTPPKWPPSGLCLYILALMRSTFTYLQPSPLSWTPDSKTQMPPHSLLGYVMHTSNVICPHWAPALPNPDLSHPQGPHPSWWQLLSSHLWGQKPWSCLWLLFFSPTHIQPISKPQLALPSKYTQKWVTSAHHLGPAHCHSSQALLQ